MKRRGKTRQDKKGQDTTNQHKARPDWTKTRQIEDKTMARTMAKTKTNEKDKEKSKTRQTTGLCFISFSFLSCFFYICKGFVQNKALTTEIRNKKRKIAILKG
jgi:hypothetical protein